MNWEAMGAVGEAVGAAGVIISLLYLAVQIRGDARAKRAATMHDETVASMDILKTLATTPDLSEIYVRGLRDLGSLEASELPRFSSVVGHMFRLFENELIHRREVQVDTSIWRGLEPPINDLLPYPGVQAWWRARSHWYGEEFQALIENKIAEGRAPSLYPGLSL